MLLMRNIYDWPQKQRFKNIKKKLKNTVGNMTKSEAAFETWTGKRALENGFVNANVTEINNDLVIVEFTR